MSVALDNYFPFDTGPGMTATPANWRMMARLFYGSGVVPGNQSQFNATISGGTVTLQPGAVWIDGFFGQTNGNKAVTGVSSGLIVARMDLSQREIYFLYLPGTSTPGQNPLASTYDVPLYQVTSASAMTDVRQFCNADPQKIARCRAYRNAAYGTATAWTGYGFDTLSYGSGITLGAGSFTCPYAADYYTAVQVGFWSTAAGQYYNVQLLHTSPPAAAVAVTWNGTDNSVVAGALIMASLTDIVPCKAGDTLSIQHHCSTAGLQGAVGSTTAYWTVRALS
jgi:hypothetical protein